MFPGLQRSYKSSDSIYNIPKSQKRKLRKFKSKSEKLDQPGSRIYKFNGETTNNKKQKTRSTFNRGAERVKTVVGGNSQQNVKQTIVDPVNNEHEDYNYMSSQIAIRGGNQVTIFEPISSATLLPKSTTTTIKTINALSSRTNTDLTNYVPKIIPHRRPIATPLTSINDKLTSSTPHAENPLSDIKIGIPGEFIKPPFTPIIRPDVEIIKPPFAPTIKPKIKIPEFNPVKPVYVPDPTPPIDIILPSAPIYNPQPMLSETTIDIQNNIDEVLSHIDQTTTIEMTSENLQQAIEQAKIQLSEVVKLKNYVEVTFKKITKPDLTNKDINIILNDVKMEDKMNILDVSSYVYSFENIAQTFKNFMYGIYEILWYTTAALSMLLIILTTRRVYIGIVDQWNNFMIGVKKIPQFIRISVFESLVKITLRTLFGNARGWWNNLIFVGSNLFINFSQIILDTLLQINIFNAFNIFNQQPANVNVEIIQGFPLEGQAVLNPIDLVVQADMNMNLEQKLDDFNQMNIDDINEIQNNQLNLEEVNLEEELYKDFHKNINEFDYYFDQLNGLIDETSRDLSTIANFVEYQEGSISIEDLELKMNEFPDRIGFLLSTFAIVNNLKSYINGLEYDKFDPNFILSPNEVTKYHIDRMIEQINHIYDIDSLYDKINQKTLNEYDIKENNEFDIKKLENILQGMTIHQYMLTESLFSDFGQLNIKNERFNKEIVKRVFENISLLKNLNNNIFEKVTRLNNMRENTIRVTNEFNDYVENFEFELMEIIRKEYPNIPIYQQEYQDGDIEIQTGHIQNDFIDINIINIEEDKEDIDLQQELQYQELLRREQQQRQRLQDLNENQQIETVKQIGLGVAETTIVPFVVNKVFNRQGTSARVLAKGFVATFFITLGGLQVILDYGPRIYTNMKNRNAITPPQQVSNELINKQNAEIMKRDRNARIDLQNKYKQKLSDELSEYYKLYEIMSTKFYDKVNLERLVWSGNGNLINEYHERDSKIVYELQAIIVRDTIESSLDNLMGFKLSEVGDLYSKLIGSQLKTLYHELENHQNFIDSLAKDFPPIPSFLSDTYDILGIDRNLWPLELLSDQTGELLENIGKGIKKIIRDIVKLIEPVVRAVKYIANNIKGWFNEIITRLGLKKYIDSIINVSFNDLVAFGKVQAVSKVTMLIFAHFITNSIALVVIEMIIKTIVINQISKSASQTLFIQTAGFITNIINSVVLNRNTVKTIVNNEVSIAKERVSIIQATRTKHPLIKPGKTASYIPEWRQHIPQSKYNYMPPKLQTDPYTPAGYVNPSETFKDAINPSETFKDTIKETSEKVIPNFKTNPADIIAPQAELSNIDKTDIEKYLNNFPNWVDEAKRFADFGKVNPSDFQNVVEEKLKNLPSTFPTPSQVPNIDKMTQIIKSVVVKNIGAEFKKLSESDPATFESFTNEFEARLGLIEV